jgi:hypothetical protein
VPGPNPGERRRGGTHQDGVASRRDFAGFETLGRQPYRAELQPGRTERAPRSRRGGAGPDPPVDRGRRDAEVDPGILAGEFGSQTDPLGRLRHRLDGAVLDAVERGQQELGPGVGKAVEQGACGVVGPDRFGADAEQRAGVQAFLDEERRRTGDVVAARMAR